MTNVLNPYQNGQLDYNTFLFEAQQPDNYYARALYAQYIHETGRGTSRIFNDANNLFGMRPAQVRQMFYIDTMTTATGNYAVYEYIKDSIDDRLDLDAYNNIQVPLTNSDVPQYYADIITKGYATDPLYIQKVTNIYNQTFSNNNLNASSSDGADDINNSLPDTTINLRKPLIGLGILLIGSFLLIRKLLKRN